MRAGAAGDAGPWRQRAILGRGRWDADAVDGVCAIEQALRCAGKGYVLGVKGDHRFGSGATSRLWPERSAGKRNSVTTTKMHITSDSVLRHCEV